MRVTIWKNDKESNERAVTRFNKKVQASRKLLVIRSERYRKKAETKKQARKAAIMREMYRMKREKTKYY